MIEPILMAWLITGIIVECVGGFYEATQGYDTRERIGNFLFNIALWPMFVYEIMVRMKER
jgi:hypothetical protein